MLGLPGFRFRLVAAMMTLSLFPGLFPQQALANKWVPTGGDEDWDPIKYESDSRIHKDDVHEKTKSVQCYVCTGGDGSECHKFPEKVDKEDCPGGNCFHQVEESPNGWAMVRRGCANLDLNCHNKDKPGMCTILPNTRDEKDSLNLAEQNGCFIQANTGKWTGKGTYEAASCVCQSDLCNTGTNVSSVKNGLKCYYCTSFDSPDCHKSPEKSEMTYCPFGYCYQDVQESSAGDGARVVRGCASEAQIDCLKKESGMCSTLKDAGPGGEEAEKFATLQECFKMAKADSSRFPDSKGGEGRSGEGTTVYTVAACACRSELCNVRTTAKASELEGGRGFIYAMVAAALLMASKATLVGPG